MTRKADKVRGRGGDDSGEASQMRTRSSRKVFVRASLDTLTTYISGTAIEAVIAKDFVDSLKKRCQEVSATEQKLLERLLFVGGNNNHTALLPSDDHPGKPLRPWQCFYELELDAAQTYASRFFRNTQFYPVKGFPLLSPDDDVVIIGSQVSNLAARTLLGKVHQKEPVFRIAHGGWRTELHWNLFTPEDAPLTTISEFGGPRKSSAHVICEKGNPVPYEAERDPARTRYVDDYLLVTTLPRRKERKQRVLIFSGLHGAGTRSVDLILREPATGLLEKAARQIAGAPYFQMLLHLETVPDERGESFPCGPELIEARALIVE
jgi:hypothetical protein